MLAIAAAVLFAAAFLLDVADVAGDWQTTLLYLGLMFLALHLAPAVADRLNRRRP